MSYEVFNFYLIGLLAFWAVTNLNTGILWVFVYTGKFLALPLEWADKIFAVASDGRANIYPAMVLHTVQGLIQLDSGNEAIIEVSAKAADYFGIAEVKPELRQIEKRGYSYHRNELSGSNPDALIRVPASKYTHLPKQGYRNNRAIKVPRQEVSARENTRTFSFNFPKRATNRDISRWLWENCHRNKPSYFLTEAGKRKPVLSFSREDYPDGEEG